MPTATLEEALPKTPGDRAALAKAIRYNWELHRRPEQWPDPNERDWKTWMYVAGRGSGKTRAGAELIRHYVENFEHYFGVPPEKGIIHFIAPTVSDLRDVMVEGDSGIISVSAPWFMPLYEPSKRRVTWPNGVKALLFSADEPERLRGPQCHLLWADEIASWRRPNTWDMAIFGNRLGANPKRIVTGTPKPTKLIKSILKDKGTYVTKGSTYDNVDNLAPSFIEEIRLKYEGSRMGRQEIHAEILEDNENALWTRHIIDLGRVVRTPPGIDIVRMIVALDPSCGGGKDSDDAGIIVAGKGSDKEYYVFDDCTCSGSPFKWARAAATAYHTHACDRVVYEKNQGGLMVESTIANYDTKLPLKGVHASRGKITRAEPISTLYEQGRVHHVGEFPELEDELCQWEPGQSSPNRLDALVWGVTDLHGSSGVAHAMTTSRDIRPQ